MGVKELISKGETKTVKKEVKVFQSEMTMSEPPSRKITREEALPSPFDSMYMSPRLDIKGMSPITTITGEIAPNGKRKRKREEEPIY